MALYAVTDRSWLGGRTLAACVAAALAGGATCVQLREKGASTAAVAAQARALLPLCRAAGAPLIVNDDVEAALLAGADGVHVGQGDAACAEARAALGPDAVVGVSVQTAAQALAAQEAGADYWARARCSARPRKRMPSSRAWTASLPSARRWTSPSSPSAG